MSTERVFDYRHSKRGEAPWAGRPLFGLLCEPPLPLQRESILPEGLFSAEFIHKIKKPKRRIFPAFRLLS